MFETDVPIDFVPAAMNTTPMARVIKRLCRAKMRLVTGSPVQKTTPIVATQKPRNAARTSGTAF